MFHHATHAPLDSGPVSGYGAGSLPQGSLKGYGFTLTPVSEYGAGSLPQGRGDVLVEILGLGVVYVGWGVEAEAATIVEVDSFAEEVHVCHAAGGREKFLFRLGQFFGHAVVVAEV